MTRKLMYLLGDTKPTTVSAPSANRSGGIPFHLTPLTLTYHQLSVIHFAAGVPLKAIESKEKKEREKKTLLDFFSQP